MSLIILLPPQNNNNDNKHKALVKCLKLHWLYSCCNNFRESEDGVTFHIYLNYILGDLAFTECIFDTARSIVSKCDLVLNPDRVVGNFERDRWGLSRHSFQEQFAQDACSIISKPSGRKCRTVASVNSTTSTPGLGNC